MSMFEMAAKLFIQKIGGGSNLDISSVMPALKALLPADGENIDIAQLVSKISSGGAMSAVSSWLGDGANEPADGLNVAEIFGQNKISAFASSLDIDSDSATKGLTDMLPDLISNETEGGGSSLLDSVGGLGGIAKKFF